MPSARRRGQRTPRGLGISRNQVECLLETGGIRSATRLGGQTSAGFSFTLDRDLVARARRPR